jgi:hypothetical protein
MANRAKWTILTYIAAHNDLHTFGNRSLDQIIGVGSTRDVMHAVLFDGVFGAARYIVGDPGRVLCQEDLADFDAGDPERLVETAHWVFSRYPAEHYGVILWSHGTGWATLEIQRALRQVHHDTDETTGEATERAAMTGSLVLFRTSLLEMLGPHQPSERAILFDDGTGHALDTVQLGQVASEIAHGIGQKLDLLGMDACLMATIEVAYQLRESVSHLVASEDLVPGLSWPYDRIFNRLRQAPDMLARQLADCIVAEYSDFYREHPVVPGAGEVTKIAVDLGSIDPVIRSLKDFAQSLLAGMPEVIPCLEQAQQSTYLRETDDDQRRPSKFDYHLWDIVSVVRELAEHCGLAAVRETAGQLLPAFQQGEFVVRSEHIGDWFAGIGGMSVYWIPPKKGRPRRISPFYREVAFAQVASWNALLEGYRYPMSW